MLQERFFYKLKIALLLVVIGHNSFAQTSPQTFTTAGAATWTAPACVGSVTVECWGGGGGAGGDGGDPGGGAPGGGGAYSSSVINITPSTVYNVNVGSGGAAGNNSNGGNGGDSWFLNATTVMAKGGNGGNGQSQGHASGTGGSAAASYGTTKYSGGNGGLSTFGTACCGNTSGGGGGSSAGPTSNGNNGGDAVLRGAPGTGGTAVAGGGAGGTGTGNGGITNSGSPGTAPGGGAGGGQDHSQGAAGGRGQVRLTWSVSSFTNKTTTICSGTTFSISPVSGSGGDNFPAGTTYSWAAPTVTGGITGGSAQSVQTSISQTLTNPSATGQTATYTVTSSGNCKFTVTVTVNPSPALTSTLTPPAICSGSTFTYTASSAASGAAFIWNRATVAGITEAGTGSTGNVNEALTNITNAPVNVTYSYTITANSCVSTQSVVVTVNPLPTASISGTTTKCLNDVSPVTTFTGANSTAPYIFSYNINGAATATVSSDGTGTGTVSAPTSSAGTFTYNLVSVQDNSCSQAQNGNAVITINPLAATLTGATTVCLNAAEPTVTFNGGGGTAPYIFTYNINNTGNTTTTSNGSGVATLTVATTSPNNFVYTLVSVQDNNSLSCVSSSSITITVNALPTATIGSDVTVCQNSTAPILTLTGTGGSNPYTFNYTINGGAVQTVTSSSGSNTANVSAPTNVVNTFTYALTNVQEGSIAVCSQAQTASTTVTVRAPSQGTVTSSVKRICQNSSSPTMQFNGAIGTPPYTFYYSTNITISGSTTHSVTSAGSTATVAVPTNIADTLVYTITGIQDASGIVCGIGGSHDSVIVDPRPYSTITANLNDVCLGDPDQTITFTGVGVPAPVTFNYYISVNGGSNQAQPPLMSVAPSVTATIAAPATTLGTTVYTNGTSSSNVCTGGGNGSARLTVNPIPTATLSLTGSSTICQSGGASQVTFTGSVGTPPFVFSYNIDGTATQTISTLPTQNNVALPLTTLSVGTHTINLLAVKDNFNCAQAQTGNVMIVVDPIPTATAGGSKSICMNGTATVSGASAANGSIDWSSNGAGTITNGNTLTPTYTADATDASKTIMLTMTVTSTNSCAPQTATAIYTVKVDSLPLAIAGGTATICQGTSATISATYSRFGSILWTHNGAGSLANQTMLTPTYTSVAGDASKTITLTMTVTSTNACASQTATANYTIIVDPLPTATSPGTQTICENKTATVSGASSSNGSISWAENGSGSITSGATTLTPIYTAATGDAGNAVLLTMTVTGTNSCNPKVATSTYTVQVDHLPRAASPGTQSICENRTATVSGASQSYGSPSWAVTSGAGNITAGGNTLSPTYAAAAGDAGNSVILMMTVTSTNTCASQTATSTYTISVDHLPTATTNGSATICENASYTLQNGEAVPMYGNPVWTENGAGSITNGANTVTPTYTANSGDAGKTVTLTMTVTSTNSCNVKPETATASYTIAVDPLPIAIAAAAQTICQGNTITLSGAAPNYGTVSWESNGQGVLTNTTTATPTYQSSAADAGKTVTLTMTVTSTNACALPITATTSATTSIIVRPLLTATLNAQQSVCQNSPAQVLFKVTSPGNPPYTFSYTQDGTQTTTTSASTTATVSVPTAIAKKIIYNLTTIQDANCTEPVTLPAQTVTVNPLPDGTISQDEDVCRDSTATAILLKGLNGQPPYTFTYTINNSSSILITGDSAFIQPKTSTEGAYVYTLTQIKDANNCMQPLTKKVTIEVHENPHAIFSVNPQRASILEPEITITDASTATTSWMWDFGDGSTSVTPKPQTHIYGDTGTYKIRLIVNNSLCRDSAFEFIRILLPTVLYIPNTFTPNEDGVNDVFKAEGDTIIKFDMRIFDRWGQLVFHSNDINKGWDGKVGGSSEAVQIDTYVYVIKIRSLADKKDYAYRGVVNVVR